MLWGRMGRQRRGSHVLVAAIYPPGDDTNLSRDVKSWHVWIMAIVNLERVGIADNLSRDDPILRLITGAGCFVATAGSMSSLESGGRYDDANPQPRLLEL